MTNLLAISSQGRWWPEYSVPASWGLLLMQWLMRFRVLWGSYKSYHGFHPAPRPLCYQSLSATGALRWNNHDIPEEFNFASDVVDYWTKMEKVRRHLWWGWGQEWPPWLILLLVSWGPQNKHSFCLSLPVLWEKLVFGYSILSLASSLLLWASVVLSMKWG